MSLHFRLTAALLAAVIAGLSSQAIAADGYGDLTGRVLFDGDVPKLLPKVQAGNPSLKIPACCAIDPIVNDSLVINPKNKGVQHVFFYLKKITKSDIHPDLKKSKAAEIVFDQKACAFKPHTLVVRTDQQVVVKSDDNEPHNTRTNPFLNTPQNFTVTPNDRVGVKMPKFVAREPLPMTVECNIHPWMKAVWLVIDHPYGTVTNANGEFKIENLPAGDYTFTIWHERVGYLDKAAKISGKKLIEAGGADVAAGNALVAAGELIAETMKVTIKARGKVNLGEIKAPAVLFDVKADEKE
ncbi:MAG: hypothetical protein ACKVHE_36175 [Planctomycetales bacterium]